MFKVICIDNKVKSNSWNPEFSLLLKEGEIYEVYDTSIGRGTDGSVGVIYFLTGINKRPNGINSDRFIPLLDIDETELVNNKQEEYA